MEDLKNQVKELSEQVLSLTDQVNILNNLVLRPLIYDIQPIEISPLVNPEAYEELRKNLYVWKRTSNIQLYDGSKIDPFCIDELHTVGDLRQAYTKVI